MKIHKDKNSYWGEFPDLPGCFTEVKNRTQLLKNARESLSLYLEELKDPKWQAPISKNRNGKNFVRITPYSSISIALLIKQARIQRGLTQFKLAKMLNMTIQQIQKLEAPNQSNPTIKTLTKISEALNFNLSINLITNK